MLYRLLLIYGYILHIILVQFWFHHILPFTLRLPFVRSPLRSHVYILRFPYGCVYYIHTLYRSFYVCLFVATFILRFTFCRYDTFTVILPVAFPTLPLHHIAFGWFTHRLHFGSRSPFVPLHHHHFGSTGSVGYYVLRCVAFYVHSFSFIHFTYIYRLRCVPRWFCAFPHTFRYTGVGFWFTPHTVTVTHFTFTFAFCYILLHVRCIFTCSLPPFAFLRLHFTLPRLVVQFCFLHSSCHLVTFYGWFTFCVTFTPHTFYVHTHTPLHTVRCYITFFTCTRTPRWLHFYGLRFTILHTRTPFTAFYDFTVLLYVHTPAHVLVVGSFWFFYVWLHTPFTRTRLRLRLPYLRSRLRSVLPFFTFTGWFHHHLDSTFVRFWFTTFSHVPFLHRTTTPPFHSCWFVRFVLRAGCSYAFWFFYHTVPPPPFLRFLRSTFVLPPFFSYLHLFTFLLHITCVHRLPFLRYRYTALFYSSCITTVHHVYVPHLQFDYIAFYVYILRSTTTLHVLVLYVLRLPPTTRYIYIYVLLHLRLPILHHVYVPFGSHTFPHSRSHLPRFLLFPHIFISLTGSPRSYGSHFTVGYELIRSRCSSFTFYHTTFAGCVLPFVYTFVPPFALPPPPFVHGSLRCSSFFALVLDRYTTLRYIPFTFGLLVTYITTAHTTPHVPR